MADSGKAQVLLLVPRQIDGYIRVASAGTPRWFVAKYRGTSGDNTLKLKFRA